MQGKGLLVRATWRFTQPKGLLVVRSPAFCLSRPKSPCHGPQTRPHSEGVLQSVTREAWLGKAKEPYIVR